MTILEAAQLVRARKVSCVELTTQALREIARLNPKLNAFLTVMEDQAMAQARALDAELAQGRYRGVLHGIPVAVKDVFCTKGVRTTCGSKIFADSVPAIDAAVVERLAEAGAVLTGKTAMHELAYGITSNNPHFGPVRNPWDTTRVPGGSSGGSGAAVAAGMVFMAMGSDTGGSIRIPAAFCGTVGLKPTTGRVSRYGVLPLDFTLDHMGPLTRSVRDAAVTLQAIAGYDARDDSSSRQPVPAYLPEGAVSLRGVRIGVPENFYFDHIDSEVESLVRGLAPVAQSLGAEIVNIRVPDIAAMNAISRVILLAEASAVMEPYLLARRADFGDAVITAFDQGRLIPATDYINAQRLRRLYTRRFRALFEKVDCLLTPTTPTPAPLIGENELILGGVRHEVRLATTMLVRNINITGLPALSLPCGFTASGLPVGAQLISRAWGEGLLLRVAAALEDAVPQARRAPVL